MPSTTPRERRAATAPRALSLFWWVAAAALAACAEPSPTGPVSPSAADLPVTAALARSTTAAGTVFIYTGLGKPGIWGDPKNWSPVGVPGSAGSKNDGVIVRRLPNGQRPQVELATVIQLAELTLDDMGVIKGGGITVTDVLRWTGGSIATPITLGPNGRGEINAGGRKDLYNLTGPNTVLLDNAGTIVVTDSVRTTGRPHIRNSGTFELRQVPGGLPVVIAGGSCCIDPSQFINTASGTLLVSGTDTMTHVSLVNSGIVRVASGSRLTLRLGYHIFHDNSRFTGGGRTQLTSSTQVATLQGKIHLDDATTTLEVAKGGEMRGMGTFVGNGTLDWTGGLIRDSVGMAPGTTMLIRGPDVKNLVEWSSLSAPPTIDNAGKLVWSDGGTIQASSRAIIRNAGTFEIIGDATLLNQSCCVTRTTVNNTGRLTKSAGAGKTILSGVLFNNTGTVNLQRGTFELTKGAEYVQGAPGLTRLSGGAMTSIKPVRMNAGTVAGAGLITGDVISGATITPEAVTFGPAGLTGVLRIAGNYTQTNLGTLQIQIKGRVAGTEYDQLRVSGTATLDGGLSVQWLGTYAPRPLLDVFSVMTYASRKGVFARTNGLSASPAQTVKLELRSTAAVLRR